MTPYTQTIFAEPDGYGHDASGKFGDCWRTAVGCLLDLPPSEIPHFADCPNDPADPYMHEHGPLWWRRSRHWLRYNYGLDLAFYGWDDWIAEPLLVEYVLLTGHSPRGSFLHCVVGDSHGRMIHDPHPSQAGIIGQPLDVCAVVQPYDPAPLGVL